MVLENTPLERTARGIINAVFGCAGERCMALPVVVVQESIADKLVELLVKFAGELKVGPAYEKTSELGPVLCVKRVRAFTEGLELMNANQFANGSVIFTQKGHLDWAKNGSKTQLFELCLFF